MIQEDRPDCGSVSKFRHISEPPRDHRNSLPATPSRVFWKNLKSLEKNAGRGEGFRWRSLAFPDIISPASPRSDLTPTRSASEDTRSWLHLAFTPGY
jgi:hypothetical protein